MIYVCLLVVFVCGAGLHRIDVKSQTDELWVPQKTQIMKNREWVSETFGSQLSQPHWHSLILSADDGNVLTPAGVNLMFDLEEKMAALDGWNATCLQRRAGVAAGVATSSAADQTASSSQPEFPACVHEGITNLWCNRTHYDGEVTASSDPAAALLDIINTRTRICRGGLTESLRVIGSPTYHDGSTHSTATPGVSNMTGARYTIGRYLVDWSKGEVWPVEAPEYKLHVAECSMTPLAP